MIDIECVNSLLHSIIKYNGHRPFGCFELRDIKTGLPAYDINGKSQSAACAYCCKTLITWPTRPFSQRQKAGNNGSREYGLMSKALDTHVMVCAELWINNLLCKWSTGRSSPVEYLAIGKWRKDYFDSRDDRHRGGKYRPNCMKCIFDNLPQPPDSEMALYLEIGLCGIAKIYNL